MNFKFYNQNKKFLSRVVILGSRGIVSQSLKKILKEKKIKNISIGSSQVNLKDDDANIKLSKKIKNNDIIIFVAAEAPVKDIEMLKNNVKICKNVCDSLKKRKIKQLIYISSDAVYSDIKGKISEKTITFPNSLHGLMHLTRESMLKSNFEKILCILRPTLIYGIKDRHNGYGPNRFVNLAIKNKPLSLFGNGEEKRDHIYADDLAKIIVKCIEKKGIGILNLATGNVYSFRYLAKEIINISKCKSQLKKVKRIGPMPHNGYRPFNTKLLKDYFGDIKMHSITEGLRQYLERKKNL